MIKIKNKGDEEGTFHELLGTPEAIFTCRAKEVPVGWFIRLINPSYNSDVFRTLPGMRLESPRTPGTSFRFNTTRKRKAWVVTSASQESLKNRVPYDMVDSLYKSEKYND
jgi:hypothetical protein